MKTIEKIRENLARARRSSEAAEKALQNYYLEIAKRAENPTLRWACQAMAKSREDQL